MTMPDPNQSDMERRLLLALLLSTVVLLGSHYLFRSLSPPAEPVPPPTEIEAPDTGPEVSEEVGEREEEPAPEPEAEAVLTRAERRTIEIENENLVMRWSTEGASVASVRLKDYAGRQGGPLELVPQIPLGAARRPLSLSLDEDEELADEVAAALYEVRGPPGGQLRAPVELEFYYRSRQLEIRRILRVPGAGYAIELESEVRDRGRLIPHRTVVGPGIGARPDTGGGGFFSLASGDFAYPKVAYYSREGLESEAVGSLEEEVTRPVDAQWVALDSQYFSYAVLSDEGFEGFELRPHKTVLEPSEPGAEGQEVPLLSAEVLLGRQARYRAFFGPKDLEVLSGVDPTLREIVDYGWFAFLVQPLLFVLKAIYGVVQNYGWAIIILTFLINLVLMPLRYKQVTSMKKMGELQPKVKAIQKRYKNLRRDDPKRQEMNREMMELYQKHGVNPLGGCLPMLVQMPFLFAFYRLLYSSIELRGAPFILWVNDLSRPDPYLVTPIAMGLTMVVQQKMTPATGDAATRRVMMLMPIMFTFIFLNVSSGLALYFLFSNLFGILFQWGMQKMSAEEEPKPRSTPKKKSRKKSGAKT